MELFNNLSLDVNGYRSITNDYPYIKYQLRKLFANDNKNNKSICLYVGTIVTNSNNSLILRKCYYYPFSYFSVFHDLKMIKSLHEFNALDKVLDALLNMNEYIGKNDFYVCDYSGLYRPSEQSIILVVNILKEYCDTDHMIKTRDDLFYTKTMSNVNKQFVDNYFKYNELFYA